MQQKHYKYYIAVEIGVALNSRKKQEISKFCLKRLKSSFLLVRP